MSDTDLPGPSDDKTPASDEPTAPLEAGPTDTEPTTPLPGATPPAPPSAPAWQPPTYAPPQQPPAYPTQYGAPQPAYQQQPYRPPAQQQSNQHTDDRPRLPRWTWPAVALLALVVGLVGGAIGGSLADDDTSGGSGPRVELPVRTQAPLPADNESIAAVAAKLLPSTVQIIAEYKGRAQGATGSGFVFDRAGHVITNNHVVAEAAADKGPIDVIDQEGKHHKATVVGRSPVYDLAVLKVEGAEKLKPAAIGSANQMRVGETVVAVGSPLALSATVTSGIVSAKNRPVTTGGDGDDASFINAVQTDAAINPGNSGGPLANLQGQVIGVNSAIASIGSSASQEAANIGVGFAIPIEQVLVTAGQILRTGKAQYPVIGVQVRGTEANDGAEVKEINAGTPAAKSDLRVGDIITEVDGTPISNQTDVVVAIRAHQAGDTVTLTVKRGSKTLEIKVGLLAKTG